MMGWFSRRHPPQVVDDADVANEMRRLAEEFIKGLAVDGWHFTWDAAQVSLLDELCDAFMRDDPPSELQHTMIMGMGSYLGELLVRCGSRWSYDVEQRAATVEMPNGLVAYPHSRIAKRLEFGPEYSLPPYLQYALTREIPLGSQIKIYP
jgi:hypothetical protein